MAGGSMWYGRTEGTQDCSPWLWPGSSMRNACCPFPGTALQQPRLHACMCRPKCSSSSSNPCAERQCSKARTHARRQHVERRCCNPSTCGTQRPTSAYWPTSPTGPHVGGKSSCVGGKSSCHCTVTNIWDICPRPPEHWPLASRNRTTRHFTSVSRCFHD